MKIENRTLRKVHLSAQEKNSICIKISHRLSKNIHLLSQFQTDFSELSVTCNKIPRLSKMMLLLSNNAKDNCSKRTCNKILLF